MGTDWDKEVSDWMKTAQRGWTLGKRWSEERAAKKVFEEIANTLGNEAAQVARSTYGRTKNVDSALEAAKAHVARKKLLQSPPPVHGDARWATHGELTEAGLTGPPEECQTVGKRIPLGQIDKTHDWFKGPSFGFWGSRGHLATFAPARSGKDAAYIIPTLLRYPASVLVMDPKGESYAETAGARKAMGSEVYRISPMDARSHCFNPLDYVEDESSARMVAEFLYPRTASGDGVYFENDAIAFLTGVVLWVALDDVDNPHVTSSTIATVYDLLTRPFFSERDGDGAVVDWVKAMGKSSLGPSRAAANLFLPRKSTSQQQIMTSLFTAMSVWGNPGLQRATSRSDFNLADLKRPGQGITVYVTLPLNKMKVYSSFLRMFFALASLTLTTDLGERDPPVLVILNEFTNMGPLDQFLDEMTYALGYGVRYWFFVQELAQLMALYPTKWKALFNSTDVRMLMDVEEVELLELVSKSFLGTKTEAVETVSVSDAFGSQTNDHLGRSAGSGGGANYGVNLQSRPLLFPDELKHYLTAKINPGHPLGAHGLVLCRGHRPFTVHRPYWFDFSWDSAQVEAGKAHLGGLEEGMMDLKAF